jgi:hypothetical protein
VTGLNSPWDLNDPAYQGRLHRYPAERRRMARETMPSWRKSFAPPLKHRWIESVTSPV